MKMKLAFLIFTAFPFLLQAQVPAPTDSLSKSMDIYGFAMMDAIYNADQIHPDWKDGLRPTKLPTIKDEYGPDGQVFFGVRQSRFGVKTYTPTKFGELKTQFEFEMYGTGVDAGQTTIRLRHAYGQLGKWGAGQYWSPFMDIDIFPNSIEYWGPTGMAFFRNVQIRYMPIQGESFMTIALERPGASADQGRYSDRIALSDVRPKFTLPDLSAEFRKAGNFGYVELAGILRPFGWEDLDTIPTEDLSDDVLGWGLNLTSNLKFGDAATVRLGVVFGQGIQNYMNDATTDVGIEVSGPDTNLTIEGKPIPMIGLSAFLDYNWNEKFSTSVGFSMLQNDLPNGSNYDAFNTGTYGLINLLYYPVENVMCGIEFQYAARDNFNEGPGYEFRPSNYLPDASATRVQVSFRYNFLTSLYRRN